MLQLTFPSKHLTSPSIPVRWTVNPMAIEKFVHEPFVVFEVKYMCNSNTSIHIFPLAQVRCYLDLSYAGNVEVTAFLVESEGGKKHLKRIFIDGDYTLYPNDVWLRGEQTARSFDKSKTHTFKVPKELFGKEYPKWVNFCLNRYWYENKPKDQCNRRRRMWAFPFTTLTLLILEVIGRFLGNVCITLLAMLFTIKVSWRDIFHNPFYVTKIDSDKSWLDPAYEKMKGYFESKESPFLKKHGDWIANFISVPAAPIVWVLAVGAAYLLHKASVVIPFIHYDLRLILEVTLLYFACLTAVVMLAWAIDPKAQLKTLSLTDLAIRLFKNIFKRKKRSFKLDNTDAQYLYGKKDIEKRSLTLLYADIKHKVCKPLMK